jgi:hypothetical protein
MIRCLLRRLLHRTREPRVAYMVGGLWHIPPPTGPRPRPDPPPHVVTTSCEHCGAAVAAALRAERERGDL